MAHGDMFAVVALFDSLTGGEVILVMIVAIMVLGPDKMPEAARTLGVWIAKLRTMSTNLQSEVREVLDDPAMQPIREVGEFMAAPRKKLVEYATAAEAEASANSTPAVTFPEPEDLAGQPAIEPTPMPDPEPDPDVADSTSEPAPDVPLERAPEVAPDGADSTTTDLRSTLVVPVPPTDPAVFSFYEGL